MAEDKDLRVQRAAAKYGAAMRRKNSTKQEQDESKRDLCAAQIAVAIDRALASSPLPMTQEQTNQFATLLGLVHPVEEPPAPVADLGHIRAEARTRAELAKILIEEGLA